MQILSNSFGRNVVVWLRQGMSPRRLAFTIAVGFAVGCIPVVGIPTVLCAALAMALRLNLPAIQAANYAAMPLQLMLIVPFVRLGGWLFGRPRVANSTSVLHLSMLGAGEKLGWMAGQALFAWLLIALPAIVLITLVLNLMLRRIPALSAAEAGD